MTKGVYLGNNGSIEIARGALGAPWLGDLNAADVNVPRRRFSVLGAEGLFITGDRIDIFVQSATRPAPNLELVDGHAFPDWNGYVAVDDAGGMRLYNNFADAINGLEADALELITPSATQRITIETSNINQYKFVSRVQNYQFTTNRNTVDLSGIGDDFQQMFASGLISGQGTIDCFWEYERQLCEDDCSGQIELPQYFTELVIRLQQGSNFAGRFHIFTDPTRSIWWDCPICIATSVAMNFEPTAPIRTRIEFVTSGQIRMRIGRSEGFLLLDQGGLLLQEDVVGSGHAIELQDD